MITSKYFSTFLSIIFHIAIALILGVLGFFTIERNEITQAPSEMSLYSVKSSNILPVSESLSSNPSNTLNNDLIHDDILISNEYNEITDSPVIEEQVQSATTAASFTQHSSNIQSTSTGVSNTSQSSINSNGSGTSNIPEEDLNQPKVPPSLISACTPRYPEGLRKRGVEGKVQVSLIVGVDGSVESAEVVDSSGYSSMDKSAIEAIYNYIFSPAKNVKGNAVRCEVTTTVYFEII